MAWIYLSNSGETQVQFLAGRFTEYTQTWVGSSIRNARAAKDPAMAVVECRPPIAVCWNVGCVPPNVLLVKGDRMI